MTPPAKRSLTQLLPAPLALAALSLSAACATEPTLHFVDDGVLASDAAAAVDATVVSDSATAPPPDSGTATDARVDSDSMAPIDDASDDGPSAVGLCPNANPPAGLTCCSSIPCVGANCAAKCNQCQKRCGTATFCCADLAPMKCALRPQGCNP